jgi:hypothetical protein
MPLRAGEEDENGLEERSKLTPNGQSCTNAWFLASAPTMNAHNPTEEKDESLVMSQADSSH